MGTALQQGANAQLAHQRVMVGIGWDDGLSWDVDACAFMIGASGRVRHDQDFVFYNQAETPCGSLVLESDTDGDRRRFRALLDRVPEDVTKITFTVTVAVESEADGAPHCGLLDQLYIRLTDLSGEEELIRFDLKPTGHERALMLGDLYRYQGGWKFRAVGQGYSGGLDTLATTLGVNIHPETPIDAPIESAPNPPRAGFFVSARRGTNPF
jgi:stress response protein SCP2